MLAALDIGLKRIGCAISFDEKIVFPVNVILRKNRNQAARDVDEFLKNNKIKILIVGIPKGGSSSDEMQRRIEHFVSLLEFDKEIIYQDEYGSSQEAKEILRGITRHKRDGKLDSMAAKIILERWIK